MVAISSEVVHVQLMENHVTGSTHFDLQIECNVHESEVTIKLFEIITLTRQYPKECAHLDLFGRAVAVRHSSSFIHPFSGINRQYV